MNRQITSEVLRDKIASYVRADAGKSADRGTLWDYWTALSHTFLLQQVEKPKTLKHPSSRS